MIVVKEHASTVRNRTGKVRFARAMPTTNPRTGMLWERDCYSYSTQTIAIYLLRSTKIGTLCVHVSAKRSVKELKAI